MESQWSSLLSRCRSLGAPNRHTVTPASEHLVSATKRPPVLTRGSGSHTRLPVASSSGSTSTTTNSSSGASSSGGPLQNLKRRFARGGNNARKERSLSLCEGEEEEEWPVPPPQWTDSRAVLEWARRCSRDDDSGVAASDTDEIQTGSAESSCKDEAFSESCSDGRSEARSSPCPTDRLCPPSGAQTLEGPKQHPHIVADHVVTINTGMVMGRRHHRNSCASPTHKTGQFDTPPPQPSSARTSTLDRPKSRQLPHPQFVAEMNAANKTQFSSSALCATPPRSIPSSQSHYRGSPTAPLNHHSLSPHNPAPQHQSPGHYPPNPLNNSYTHPSYYYSNDRNQVPSPSSPQNEYYQNAQFNTSQRIHFDQRIQSASPITMTLGRLPRVSRNEGGRSSQKSTPPTPPPRPRHTLSPHRLNTNGCSPSRVSSPSPHRMSVHNPLTVASSPRSHIEASRSPSSASNKPELNRSSCSSNCDEEQEKVRGCSIVNFIHILQSTMAVCVLGEVCILRSPRIAAFPICLLSMGGVCGRSLTSLWAELRVFGRSLTVGKILFTGRQTCSLYLVL